MPARGIERFRVAVYDYGVKRRSLELLAGHGCSLTIYPSTTPAEVALEEGAGFVLSVGPARHVKIEVSD